MANPESLREVGVKGNGGKEPPVGESWGEGGEVPLIVEPVVGLLSVFGGRKALNTGGRAAKFEALSPNAAELRLANFARALGTAMPVKIPGFSEEKALKG